MKRITFYLSMLLSAILLVTYSCKDKIDTKPDEIVYTGNLSFENMQSIISFYEKGYTVLNGNISIEYNDTLTNLYYLSNLKRIHGELMIVMNPNLESLEGLNQLDTVTGNFSIVSCTKLSNLKGLDGLKYVGGEFKILSNNSLVNAEGLNNLSYIEVKLKFAGNANMTSLKGLENLRKINKVLEIGFIEGMGNPKLESIAALSNLKEVGYLLEIGNNDTLTSLEGLEGLEKVGTISIQRNKSLSDFCSLNNLINNNGFNGSFKTDANGYNPTLDDMKAGNCLN